MNLGDIGIGFARRSLRRIEFLTADRILRDERAIALHNRIGIRRSCPCTLEACLRLRIAGSQFGWVDAEQRLALTDIGAFLIHAVLDDPGHTRSHFGNADGFDTARKLNHIVEVFHANRDRLHRERLALSAVFRRRTGDDQGAQHHQEEVANILHYISLPKRLIVRTEGGT